MSTPYCTSASALPIVPGNKIESVPKEELSTLNLKAMSKLAKMCTEKKPRKDIDRKLEKYKITRSFNRPILRMNDTDLYNDIFTLAGDKLILSYLEVDQPVEFKIGDIVVCERPITAGASRYPKFAKITKITPTGKFRLAYLYKSYPECKDNSSGNWGYKRLTVPTDEKSVIGLLVKRPDSSWQVINKDHVLVGPDKHTDAVWIKYDPFFQYWDEFDNRD